MNSGEPEGNTFSEDGRLLQTEYAIRNVSEAGTIAGVACGDGVVLVGVNTSVCETREKIYKLGETAYCAVAGLFSDAHRLVTFARLSIAQIQETIKRPPSLSVICDEVSRKKQWYTQAYGARPFGVAFLYAGLEQGKYALYATDPSGTVNRWKAWSFGIKEEAINNGLVNDMPEEPKTTEEGLRELLKVISKARENPADAAKTMEILVYKKEGPKLLNEEEIRQALGTVEADLSVRQ